MAKRVASKKYSYKSDVDELATEVVKPEVKAVKLEKAVSTRQLQLQISVRYVINGDVTGNKYVWSKAGDTQPVASEDAPALLAKRVKSGCCGPNVDKPVFVEVG